MKLDKFFDIVINKFHIVLGATYASTLAGYCIKTGHDIGPGLTNATYAFYAFLLGHAGVYQKWPDNDQNHDGVPDAQQQPAPAPAPASTPPATGADGQKG